MAQNFLAKQAEKVIGHSDQNRAATTDISNPALDGGKYADPSGEKMKALVWMGKNDVRVGMCPDFLLPPLKSLATLLLTLLTLVVVETNKPKIINDHDAIVKVTGSTVCGSDVHILHGQIVQTEKGDILGHEFCGVVESVGPAVKHVKPGERVVNSFCISCGECQYCKKKLPTACEKTNASTLQKDMYGGQLSGIFGYSHFVGGYAGGQAEYVRVPLADNNLLKIPDSVPDEKGKLRYLAHPPFFFTEYTYTTGFRSLPFRRAPYILPRRYLYRCEGRGYGCRMGSRSDRLHVLLLGLPQRR